MTPKRNGTRTPLPQATASLIAKGARLEGDLKSDGTVRIEGSVKGTVTAGKAIVVVAGGEIDGALETKDALISGTVKGRLAVSSRLEVKKEAVIVANVKATRMQVEYGAVFSGALAVGDSSEESQSKSDETRTDAETVDVAIA